MNRPDATRNAARACGAQGGGSWPVIEVAIAGLFDGNRHGTLADGNPIILERDVLCRKLHGSIVAEGHQAHGVAAALGSTRKINEIAHRRPRNLPRSARVSRHALP
ncbi:MAG: hypothetical protein Q7J60_22160 [Bradyrhizobium sp.]|nr:hypothetical protein [Bradyrhizobium sp.]